MITPESPKVAPIVPKLSPQFRNAFPENTLIIKPRTGAYARTADDKLRMPWESLTVKISGSLDLREHSTITRKDIPGQLDITGDLILDFEKLEIVTGQDITIEGSLIIYVPAGTPDQSRIQGDAWAIDGMSIGRDVVVRERKVVNTDVKSTGKEDFNREKEYTRLSAMSREEFANYLVAHRKDYAELSKRQTYNDPKVSKNELYELMIIKPSRRGKPITDLNTPIFGEQIRAKNPSSSSIASLPSLSSFGR